jgi:hypothetical protein
MTQDEKIQAWRGMTKQELWRKYTPRLIAKELTNAQYDQILSYGKEDKEPVASDDTRPNEELLPLSSPVTTAGLIESFGDYEVNEPEGKSQKVRIEELLLDGQPHTVDEIRKKVYGVNGQGNACIHSRVTELREKYGKERVPDAKKNDQGEWYYQIINQSQLV